MSCFVVVGGGGGGVGVVPAVWVLFVGSDYPG